MSVPTSVPQRLMIYRKRLDQMGYHEPLPIEALPLVEQLFTDLIQTTESLKSTKIQSSQLLKEKEILEKSIEPYKKENCKLVKENNELHKQIMIQKETFETVIRDVKGKQRKLEHENADLCFLNSHYLHKVHSLEHISQEKSKTIMKLQEKTAEAVVQTPGGKKYTVPLRRQRMEILEPLPLPDLSVFQRIQNQVKDPYVADMLQMASETTEKFQKENHRLLEALEQAHETVNILEEKVDLREREIYRLTVQLSGGRPLETVFTENMEKEKNQIIDSLTTQLEKLHHQNEELEHQLISLERRPVSPHREKLPMMKNLADKLETDSEMDKRRKLSQKTKTSSKEEAERGIKKDKTKHQEVDVHKYHNDTKRLEKIINQVSLEKDKLSKKVNTLLANEKQLITEIDRLSKKVSPHGMSPPQSTEHMAKLIHLLEAQRDYYKEEFHTLQRIVEMETTLLDKEHRRNASNAKVKLMEKNMKNAEYANKNRQKSVLELIEGERDYYKKKYQEISEMQTTEVAGKSVTTADKEILAVDNDLESIKKENRDLKEKIKELENLLKEKLQSEPPESEKEKVHKENLERAVIQLQHRLDELQLKMEMIAMEKQSIVQQYQQVIQENSQLRTTMTKNADIPLLHETPANSFNNAPDIQTNPHMPVFFSEVDVQENVKKAINIYVAEIQKLQKHVEQLKNTILEFQRENNNFEENLAFQKTVIASLEENISILKYKLSQALEESNQHKCAAEQIRMMADHGEQSVEEMRQYLIQKESQVNAAENKARDLENSIEKLNDVCLHYEKEIANLRSSLATEQQEKQHLLDMADQKGLQLSSVQQQMFSKEQHTTELRITASALESEVDKLQKEMREKDKEIQSLKHQFEIKTKEVMKISQSQEVISRENLHLLDELSTLTKENQVLTQQLEDKLCELGEVKRQVQEYVTEVSRVQELLAVKEQQRSELLQQYQNLSQENTVLETQTHRLQSQTSAIQMEVEAKDAELQQCHDTIFSLEQEIEEYLSTQEARRLEMTMLNSSVNGLELELQQKQQELDQLQSDLTASRTLSVQLDSTRDHLQKMLINEEAAKKKLILELDDAKEEINVLRAQLASERISVLNLEGLMASHREKDFRSHLTNQEFAAEVKLLRDRLQENEQKLESQSKEIANYSIKLVEMEMETERLKRQVTNEKYERERANNELTRLQEHHQLYVNQNIENPQISTYQRITIHSTPAAFASFNEASSLLPSTKKKSSESNESGLVLTSGPNNFVSSSVTDRVLKDKIADLTSSRDQENTSTSRTVEISGRHSPLTPTSGIVSQWTPTRELSDGTTQPSTPHEVITPELQHGAGSPYESLQFQHIQSSSSTPDKVSDSGTPEPME